jgi:hypothetical protein
MNKLILIANGNAVLRPPASSQFVRCATVQLLQLWQCKPKHNQVDKLYTERGHIVPTFLGELTQTYHEAKENGWL